MDSKECVTSDTIYPDWCSNVLQSVVAGMQNAVGKKFRVHSFSDQQGINVYIQAGPDLNHLVFRICVSDNVCTLHGFKGTCRSIKLEAEGAPDEKELEESVLNVLDDAMIVVQVCRMLN